MDITGITDLLYSFGFTKQDVLLFLGLVGVAFSVAILGRTVHRDYVLRSTCDSLRSVLRRSSGCNNSGSCENYEKKSSETHMSSGRENGTRTDNNSNNTFNVNINFANGTSGEADNTFSGASDSFKAEGIQSDIKTIK